MNDNESCNNCKHVERPSSCSSLPWEREWWICDECNDMLSEWEPAEDKEENIIDE